MEKESFLSGYCRNMDAARMVEVLTDAGTLLEADCDYGCCPHEPSCPIAQNIHDLLET